MKAHFRLTVCLYELGKLKDSKMYLDQFTKKYPSYKTSAAYKCLFKDLVNGQSMNKERIGNYFISIFVFIYLIFYINYLLIN